MLAARNSDRIGFVHAPGCVRPAHVCKSQSIARPILPQDGVAEFLSERPFTMQASLKRQDVNWHGEEAESRTKRRYNLRIVNLSLFFRYSVVSAFLNPWDWHDSHSYTPA